MPGYYNGFSLLDCDRKLLLDLFPPKYEIVRCDHVTQEISDSPLDMPFPYPMSVTGYIDSGFMEVLTVEVNGMASRPHGGFYHITHSYTEGHRSLEANHVILAFDHQQKAFVGIGGTPFSLRRRS